MTSLIFAITLCSAQVQPKFDALVPEPTVAPAPQPVAPPAAPKAVAKAKVQVSRQAATAKAKVRVNQQRLPRNYYNWFGKPKLRYR